jgi:CheY-like chemotaxis protein
MNAILGWSQLLRARERSADDVAEGLAIIERNARVQTQLIDDLLDMSRIISGKIRLDVQRVDLQIVVEAAIEALLPAAQAKDIHIEKALDLPHAGCVTGDPGRLQQIVWNLLSNAVKFTPRGGFVAVSLRRGESRVEIVVSDTGQGIKPEFLPSVFDRFRQADASTTRQHAGLGLGLAIVRHLTELHGGKARVHSDGDGRGATFTIELPVQTPHALPDSEVGLDDKSAGALLAGAVGALAGPKLLGVRVLVVDDEHDARVLVKRLLEECDATVVTADSVVEGLAAIARDTPHVLISDIGMPGQDGYDLVRLVRAMTHDHAAKLPAVALTAFARSEDRTRAMMAGFDMHVAKPVEPAELLAVVARLAGRAG